jgi:hypothetical protein
VGWAGDLTIRRDGSFDVDERWPEAQLISMRDTAAALTRKLGYEPERNIGHKEYAGSAQGKWDPGNIDMNWFRGEIAKAMRGEFAEKPTPRRDLLQTPQVRVDRRWWRAGHRRSSCDGTAASRSRA